MSVLRKKCCCGEELQACCFPDESCADLTPAECEAQGGLPQGEGTACATTDCSLPDCCEGFTNTAVFVQVSGTNISCTDPDFNASCTCTVSLEDTFLLESPCFFRKWQPDLSCAGTCLDAYAQTAWGVTCVVSEAVYEIHGEYTLHVPIPGGGYLTRTIHLVYRKFLTSADPTPIGSYFLDDAYFTGIGPTYLTINDPGQAVVS